jgi:hypothetical protein
MMSSVVNMNGVSMGVKVGNRGRVHSLIIISSSVMSRGMIGVEDVERVRSSVKGKGESVDTTSSRNKVASGMKGVNTMGVDAGEGEGR